MGCISSTTSTIARPDGNGSDFDKRYELLNEIGKGQFASVHKILHRDPPVKHFAAKVMKKGVTVADGVVHMPLSKEALSREVDILRVLEGKKNVITLCGVYESSSKIFIVTELCAGGDLFTYLRCVSATTSEAAKFSTQQHLHKQTLTLYTSLRPSSALRGPGRFRTATCRGSATSS